ncbi:hypothetical protein [Actinomadura opuntiae]|uniref:hypothetical protein n=1 Tax=Actinomadura sp. OS1-43 TaxID=604315 RepID=UPI00255AEE9A|nr:hypothetical protein [Actinomadura sp. OS1-43]MDL4813475.1 hypothetical protein [Actinomadura sp. OS1-43]
MPDTTSADDPRDLTPAAHLDALARALADAGWSSTARYDRIPALMHVFARDMPGFGESVRVTTGTDGTPWFLSSTGDLLAPCQDPASATTKITAILAPLLTVVRPPSSG